METKQKKKTDTQKIYEKETQSKVEQFLALPKSKQTFAYFKLSSDEKELLKKIKKDNEQSESSKNKTIEVEQEQASKVEDYLSLPKSKQVFAYLKLSSDDKKLVKKIKKEKTENVSKLKVDFNKDHVFEVRDLNLWYENKHKQALFDISVNLKRNKVTALIGPSGCGKSTFIKCLNRMNDLIPGLSATGNIYFDNGTNLKSPKLSRTELTTRVGMIFQKYSPFPMSIYDNVAYGPRSHGITDKKILDKIVKESLMGAALWDEVKEQLHGLGTSLSGGQQQRLCIARAIALEPEVLLMDEPTSGLDPIATAKIENLIDKLKERFTIIIVTHSMAQAQRISDETAFFYQGKIIEHDTTKKIFMSPRENKTRDYISGRIG